MGFHLILNFNNPYLATGLGDFWSRWHISLFHLVPGLRFIFARRKQTRHLQHVPDLFLTFFISGIWHGAAWTFFIWEPCMPWV